MSKMRWTILLLLIISLVISCATYTSNMGYEKIVLEDNVGFKETRYKAILEEKEKIAEEKRVEQERIAEEKRLEAERVEQERLAEEARIAEKERLEAERIEQERIAEEARIAEKERLEAERVEQERLAEEARIAEEERLEAERIEQERLAEEARIAEEERLEAERIEQERIAEEARIAEEKRLEAERIEKERLAEEKRKAEEERKAKEEALAQSLAKARRINSYPSDLKSMNIPHIYRPQDNPIKKDDNFTRLDVLFIPLGSTKNDIDAIVSSISDIKVDFIFITGSIEDRVAISKKLARDTVTLDGGSIIFTSELLKANGDTASFKVSESKDIEIAIASLSDNGAVKSKDIESWREYISLESNKDCEKVLSVVDNISDSQAIFALSSSQPSTLDWSIFTPYSYRTDANFAISDELNKTMSDTYRATHFSEETDGGITIITPVLSERLDFLYSKGLIEVSSDTLAISGLSNMDIERFAILATYIIP